jgi:hypothetical protein
MRVWVCPLQLLLDLAISVILGFKSRGINDRILLPQIRDPPTWRVKFSYVYLPGKGWPCYIPRHWVPFSSPPTTRRATMEVFEPASTRGRSRPLLANGRNRFVTSNDGVTGERCFLSGACDNYDMTKQ